MRKAQEELPADQQDQSQISRAEAELAETVAVLPTIVVKVNNWKEELEGVMGTIEAAHPSDMDAVRQSPEWQAAQAALDNA